MGLREDMEDLCAGMVAARDELERRVPEAEVKNLLALKSRYNVSDLDEFVEVFKRAASASNQSVLGAGHTRLNEILGLELPLQSIYFHLILELGLQEQFQSALSSHGTRVGLSTLRTMIFLLSQKSHLFSREMLIHLQDFGKKYADASMDDPKRSPWGIVLSQDAAKARSRAVLLRIALKETPEIAEHGDEITARLTTLGADHALLETLRLAVVNVTPHASEAVLANSIDRSRAFLEEMLRFLRRLLESKGHVPSVASEPVTPREILNSLSKIFASHEDELFQKFFNLISVKGSHTTSALLNQARLARNLTIELAFYVLEKVRHEYAIG